MLSETNLRNAALALGVVSGLIELYIAATAVAATGRSSNYTGFMLFVVPWGVIAGAVAIRYYRETYLGAGVILVSIAIMHVLVEIKGMYFLPILLAAGAGAIGVYLDSMTRNAAPALR